MKTLFVLRHAKSSWDDFNLSDFDRPLNRRGLRTAPLMGEKMYQNSFQPAIIISSPAKRAKQTAILVKESAQIPRAISYDERIYEASPFKLLQIVSELDDKRDSAMLVGHNPGLEGLVKLLTGGFRTMPTAALAVIDLDIENWSEIAADCGKLRILIRPKDDLKSLGAA
jgi:phosphohistidine phosphatase